MSVHVTGTMVPIDTPSGSCMAHTPPTPVPDDRERGLEHTGPGEISLNSSPFIAATLSWDGSTFSVHDQQGILIFSAPRSSLVSIEQHGTTLQFVTTEGTLVIRFGTSAARFKLAIQQNPAIEDSLETNAAGGPFDADQHIEKHDYEAISSSEYGVWYGIFAQVLIDDGKMNPARNDYATYGLDRGWRSFPGLGTTKSSTILLVLLVVCLIVLYLFFGGQL